MCGKHAELLLAQSQSRFLDVLIVVVVPCLQKLLFHDIQWAGGKNLCHAMPCHHTKGLTHDQVSNKAMTG